MNKDIIEKLSSGREYRKMVLEVKDTDDDKCTVRGYATTFNEAYTLWEEDEYRFEELVDPDAFAKCDMSDVIMQFDHCGRVFARLSNGTLRLTIDNHGLFIEADLGGTSIGRQLYEEIKGGYVTKMSFGFTVEADDIEELEVNGRAVYRRIIKAFRKLYDVSAVSLPANDGTEISARSFCDGVIEKLEAERLKKAERNREIEALEARINAILEV